MAGFRCFQSPSRLVTEMKSEPKKTRETSGMANRAVARGERPAVSALGKSATAPSPITSRPGRNLRVAGLGVDSVWMNMGAPGDCTPYMDPREGGFKQRIITRVILTKVRFTRI